MTAVRRLAAALAAGGLAGLAALGLDVVLDLLTLGHAALPAPRFVVAYAFSGMLAAAVVELAWRSPRRDRLERFAAALALLYAPPVFERVFFAIDPRLGTAAAAAAGLLAVAGYGAWIALLRRAAGARTAAAFPRRGAIGTLVGAVTTALLLAIHRNLIEQLVTPSSIAAAVGVAAAGLALALLASRSGARRAAAAAALGVAALALAAALHRQPRPAPATSAAVTERPASLLLVVIDTLRQDVFDAVVEETEEGRSLEARLEGAVLFDRAVAAAPWTSPSVASILTGLYPAEHGFAATALADALPENLPTLAEKLQRRGYRTEALVANPVLYPASGIYRGFRRYEVLTGATSRLPLLTALARVGLVREDLYQDAAAVRRRLASRLGELAAAEQPFFLWLLLMDPHPPWREHRDLSPDPGAGGLHPQERLYRDEVRFALRELSRTIDLLEDRGLWRDTLLILVADHGEMFPTDGHWGDGAGVAESEPGGYGRHGVALYRELVRVPLVIRLPGASGPSRRLDVLTSHVDLHDTILDLLGLDAPRIGRDRVSVAPWIAGPGPHPRRQAALSSGGATPQRALETATFKLIDPLEDAHGPELFDTAADPRELHNLAAERPQLAAELTALLEAVWNSQAEPPEASPVSYDRATLERLRALGYVE